MQPQRDTNPTPSMDRLIDTSGEDSFPASDPPARTPVTGVGRPPTQLGQAPEPPEADGDSPPATAPEQPPR